MHLFGGANPWLLLTASLGLFFLSAKLHGRQIRLERELEGYTEVRFGSGDNPPFVEALWRRDRTLFWSILPGYMVGLGLLAAAFGYGRRGDAGGFAPVQAGDWGALALVVLVWAPALTFWTNGLVSLARFRRALAQGGKARGKQSMGFSKRTDIAWRSKAGWGTLGLWSACSGGVVVIAALLI